MPLKPTLYSAEQIFLQPAYAYELKQLEKAVLRQASAGALEGVALLLFCRDWFASLEAERLDRLAREEAWRREWSGKKGQLKAVFDSIDTDGSGTIEIDELAEALQQIPTFFGYSAEVILVPTPRPPPWIPPRSPTRVVVRGTAPVLPPSSSSLLSPSDLAPIPALTFAPTSCATQAPTYAPAYAPTSSPAPSSSFAERAGRDARRHARVARG